MLERALAPQGFVAFAFSDLSADALASLESAVATAESTFTEITEKPEWGIVAGRLKVLAESAVFLALRLSAYDIDVFIGRATQAIDVPQGKDYCEFVRRLLADMHGAATGFKLSDGTVQLVAEAAGSADAAVKLAAGLVLPLLRFHGGFISRVLFSVPHVPPDLEPVWTRAQIVASETFGPSAYVEGWLWDLTTLHVVDTDNSAWLARKPIPNLDTAQELEQNLRYTGT